MDNKYNFLEVLEKDFLKTKDMINNSIKERKFRDTRKLVLSLKMIVNSICIGCNDVKRLEFMEQYCVNTYKSLNDCKVNSNTDEYCCLIDIQDTLQRLIENIVATIDRIKRDIKIHERNQKLIDLNNSKSLNQKNKSENEVLI